MKRCISFFHSFFISFIFLFFLNSLNYQFYYSYFAIASLDPFSCIRIFLFQLLFNFQHNFVLFDRNFFFYEQSIDKKRNLFNRSNYNFRLER